MLEARDAGGDLPHTYRIILGCGAYRVLARSEQAAVFRAKAEALDGGATEESIHLVEFVDEQAGLIEGVEGPARRRVNAKHPPVLLEGPIPPYITQKEALDLCRQYGVRVSYERLVIAIAAGEILGAKTYRLGKTNSGGYRVKLTWAGVKAWVDRNLIPIPPNRNLAQIVHARPLKRHQR